MRAVGDLERQAMHLALKDAAKAFADATMGTAEELECLDTLINRALDRSALCGMMGSALKTAHRVLCVLNAEPRVVDRVLEALTAWEISQWEVRQ